MDGFEPSTFGLPTQIFSHTYWTKFKKIMIIKRTEEAESIGQIATLKLKFNNIK